MPITSFDLYSFINYRNLELLLQRLSLPFDGDLWTRFSSFGAWRICVSRLSLASLDLDAREPSPVWRFCNGGPYCPEYSIGADGGSLRPSGDFLVDLNER
jgi:hypothetical protein